jgi:hypothetical protein
MPLMGIRVSEGRRMRYVLVRFLSGFVRACRPRPPIGEPSSWRAQPVGREAVL